MGAVMPDRRSAPVNVVFRAHSNAWRSRFTPVAMGNRCAAPFTLRRPTIEARHLGRGAGLINEHKSFWLEIGLGVEPGFAPTPHVGTLLLAGVCGFF